MYGGDRYFGCCLGHCSWSPSSIDQIYVLKLVLHYQIYDEASIKTRPPLI